MLDVLTPSKATDTTMTAAISEAINAYSTDEAPASPVRLRSMLLTFLVSKMKEWPCAIARPLLYCMG